MLGEVALGQAFDVRKDACQVAVQSIVGAGGHVGKQLSGLDKVAFGLDGVVLNFRRDDIIRQLGVLNAVIVSLDVDGKVLAKSDRTECRGRIA